MRSSKIYAAAALVAAACFFWMAMPAKAGFVVQIKIGSDIRYIDDDDPGTVAGHLKDQDTTDNQTILYGTPTTGTHHTPVPLDGYQIQLLASDTNSPGDTSGLLDLSTFKITNISATVPITISFSTTPFNAPGSSGQLVKLTQSIGGSFTNSGILNSIKFQGFAGNGTMDFDTGVPPGTAPSPGLFAFIPTSTPSFNQTTATTFVRGSQYGLDAVTTLNLVKENSVTFGGFLQVDPIAPEPSEGIILISALPLFGALGLWRLRKARLLGIPHQV
jgi:hypothetical protein